jgi:uncharacterized repeat protein (TIGR01451 family)
MKNVKLIFFALAFINFANKSVAQIYTPSNSLSIVGATSQTNLCDGDIITIKYSMEYIMAQDSAKQIVINFNPSQFDFLTTNFGTASNNVFNIATNNLGQLILRTNTFSADDNNFLVLNTFTLSFRVKNNTCNPAPSAYQITAHMATIKLGSSPLVEVDPTSIVTYNVSVTNCSSLNTVSISLHYGKDCEFAIYKVASYGYDDPANNSTIKFIAPIGYTIMNVYNTNGALLTSPQLTMNGNTAQWERSGISAEIYQEHYVVVTATKSIICANSNNDKIKVEFKSTATCNIGGGLIQSNTERQILCCIAPPPCPTCPPPPPPPNVDTVKGGVVGITKVLIKTPFRYFPEPNNCKSHEYIITITNASPNPLSNFNFVDTLENIIGSLNNEIRLSDGDVSISSLIGSTAPSFTSTIGFPTSGQFFPVLLNNANASKNFLTNIGWAPPVMPITEGMVALNSNGSFPDLPPMSVLKIKFTHFLENNAVLPSSIYDNYAYARFGIGTNNYKIYTNVRSKQDTFAPVIKLEKFVRDSSTKSSFQKCVNANMGDTLEFMIRIRNYGITNAIDITLYDTIINPLSFCFDPFVNGTMPFTVTDATGMHTPAELLNIRTQLMNAFGSMTNNKVQINFPRILANICNGYSEICIRYFVEMKKPPTAICDTTYKNIVGLTFSQAANPTVYTRVPSDSVCAKADIFYGMQIKFEATCNPNVPSSWKLNTVNALPGQIIYYRLSVKNNNNFPIPDFKYLIQMPSGVTAANNISNHGTSAVASSANQYGALVPAMIFANPTSFSSTNDMRLINNFLSSTSLPVSPFLSPNKTMYKTVSLLPNSSMQTLNFQAITPINLLGTAYKIGWGVSIFSNISNGQCQKIKVDSFATIVSETSNCGNLGTCDYIKFDTAIKRIGSSFQINLNNITDLNAGTYPNLDTVSIIVHQPYNNCNTQAPLAIAPYNKYMYGYNITSPLYNTFSNTPPLNSAQDRKINFVASPGTNFNNLMFKVNLNATPNQIPFGCTIIPVNIIFKSKNNDCTLCERMIYFKQ